jgi:EmrB/QacA subfamily drug resistance transporter
MQQQDPQLSELRLFQEEKTSQPCEQVERNGHSHKQERRTGETVTLPVIEPRLPRAAAHSELQGGRSATVIETNKWLVFGILAIGVFMATLDGSIVNISLPTIAHYFHVPLNGAVEWVTIAYLVTTASMLLTAGRLADMVGQKPVWLLGLVIFTFGSAICGAAPSLLFLVIARGFQGIGGALMMAISPAMLTSAFPPSERGRALGLNAINVALGVSVGPTVGGLITTSLSWRWIFYVNVPVGIIGLLATWFLLKERHAQRQGRFDPLGALTLGLGLAGITLALSFGQELGWFSPFVMVSLLGGLAALIALYFIEQRVAYPVIDFSLLRRRVFLSANISLILCFMSLFAVSFLMPFYLEQLHGFPTEVAGLLLTPLPITLACVAPLSGSLADRIGSRWLAATGLAISCLGLILLGQLNAHSSIWDIIWRLVVTGMGQAIFQSPNSSALMGDAPREQQGSASGFLATGRTMGQSISVALSGAVFTSLGGADAGLQLVMLHAHGALSAARAGALEQTFSHAFQSAFLVCALIAAIGVGTSLVRGKEERRRHQAGLTELSH